MADILSWKPENIEKLISDLQAEVAALKEERDTFRDAWRALVAKSETQPLDIK